MSAAWVLERARAGQTANSTGSGVGTVTSEEVQSRRGGARRGRCSLLLLLLLWVSPLLLRPGVPLTACGPLLVWQAR